jgi:hypothetical protein
VRFGLFILIVTSCLARAGSANLAASTPTPLSAGLDNVAEASLLTQAYDTLAKADHDYDGHRKKAMKDITAACDDLGQGIGATGGRKERQHVSDDELRAAQRIVERVRDNAMDRNQHKVVTHLDDAINEISQALDVK